MKTKKHHEIDSQTEVAIQRKYFKMMDSSNGLTHSVVVKELAVIFGLPVIVIKQCVL